MFNLDDILRQAQGGDAAQTLARQFGVSTQQAQAAMEALAPAFQMGLKRQAQDPQAMGSLLDEMSKGSFAHAYADPAAASKAQGDAVLSSLFGSKDGSRAVAQHAAALSGVPASILKAMLPVIASMIMGGLFKQANNQGLGGVLGQLGSILTGGGGMFGGGQPQPRTTQADASGGLGGGLGPLGDILGGMLGGGAAQRGGAGGGLGGGGLGGGLGPLGDILGQVLGGGAGLPQGTGPQPAPRPRMPQDDGSLGGSLGGSLDGSPGGGGGLGGGGLGDILGDLLGGGRGRAPDDEAGPAGEGLPQRRSRGGVEDEISDMLGGGRAAPQGGGYARQGGGYDRQEEDAPLDAPQQGTPGGGSLGDILGQMFETGPRSGGGSSADWNDVLGQILGQRRR